MPELPEVETVRRQLEPLVTGRVVTSAGGHPSPKFCTAGEAAGSELTGLRRRGKYLIASLDGPADRELVVHLGMTGVLRLRPAATTTASDDPFVRAWWVLDDGQRLELRDIRRFGRVAVVAAGDYTSMPTLATLGPEPLTDDFAVEPFWRALRGSRLRVKTQLLSQRPVAGVGNIYADEALWLSGIHPARRTVTRAEAERLRDAIRTVLAAGVANGGTTLRDYRTPDGGLGSNQHHLDCYGRSGEPCSRCGEVLSRKVVDGRGTTFCRRCQPSR